VVDKKTITLGRPEKLKL